MAQHRSQRGGGAVAGGGSSGSTSADGEVRVGLTDLIVGKGPEAPQYGRVFSQAASLRFFTQYAEFERNMALSNKAQSISRPVLSVAAELQDAGSRPRSSFLHQGVNLFRMPDARSPRS